jgi:hypothetical protein
MPSSPPLDSGGEGLRHMSHLAILRHNLDHSSLMNGTFIRLFMMNATLIRKVSTRLIRRNG